MTQNVCVVIGAGSGLGAALARRFGREGMRVALVARQQASLASLEAALTAEGITAKSFIADAGDVVSLKQALTGIGTQWDHPDVLLYNAVYANWDMPTFLSPEELLQSLRTNVIGAFVATQQVISAMRERGQGTILFTGGGYALYPSAATTAVGVGKAALRHLAFDFADEVGEQGIHVATVTICGTVQPGTHFDPNQIADVFWQVHSQPQAGWETEFVYR